MNDFVIRLLCNASWQIPLAGAAAWCAARCLRRWPASWLVTAWRTAWILAVAAPIATSLWTLPGAAAYRIVTSTLPVAAGLASAPAPGMPPASWLFALYSAFVAWRAASLFAAWRRLRDLHEDNIQVPLTFGFRDPRILLPSRFRTLAPEPALRAAVAHEQAHVAHRDYLVQLLLEIITTPVAFHPAILWIRRRTLDAVEMRCDETAAHQAFPGDLRGYASALLEAAQVLGPESTSASPRLAAAFQNQNTFEERIMNLIEPKSLPGKLRAAVAAFALLTAGALVAGMSATLSAQPPDKVYKSGEDGVLPPKLIHKVEPKYTDQARDEKVSGTVILSAEIAKTGVAENIEVKRKLEPTLDQAAIEAVRQWKFEPATRNGEAVRVRATIEVNFRRQ